MKQCINDYKLKKKPLLSLVQLRLPLAWKQLRRMLGVSRTKPSCNISPPIHLASTVEGRIMTLLNADSNQLVATTVVDKVTLPQYAEIVKLQR